MKEKTIRHEKDCGGKRYVGERQDRMEGKGKSGNDSESRLHGKEQPAGSL